MRACIAIIPSFDLQKSLRFWVDGLGLTADSEMYEEGRLIGCAVRNAHVYFWLNQRAGGKAPDDYDGIRLYWTPDDLYKTRQHLKDMGYGVSEIEEREYGLTEFVMKDDDGYWHCFGLKSDG